MRVHETPDERYIVLNGRLWRRQRPDLEVQQRDQLVHELMDARRALRAGRRSGEQAVIAQARAAVDIIKRDLGELGPVWWTDGAPDLDRRLVKNTSYAGWYDELPASEKTEPPHR
ncbi:hypothetical protein [Methylobacterium sp. WL9]|uniref:hypothetical protein n=1 Tax=Methylobacterium sp. WL9 TaxID=2603898 RepID=UPI0011CBC853|nr:hypothetical protein [Methylobacterium sp. WL9]TXN21826.1 hypothetical protein FV217_13075 [Methylobacterium sp. WL9]